MRLNVIFSGFCKFKTSCCGGLAAVSLIAGNNVVKVQFFSSLSLYNNIIGTELSYKPVCSILATTLYVATQITIHVYF